MSDSIRVKPSSWHFAFKVGIKAVDDFLSRRNSHNIRVSIHAGRYSVEAATEEDANELVNLIRQNNLTDDDGVYLGATIDGTLQFVTKVVTP